MAEGQQAVVGVFAVQLVVAPVAVERAAIGPKAIDKIETRLGDLIHVGVHPGQRVQRGGGREQIGQRRIGKWQKSHLPPRIAPTTIPAPADRRGWPSCRSSVAAAAVAGVSPIGMSS